MPIWRFLPAKLWEAPGNPAVPGTPAQAACLPAGGHGAPSPTWRTSCPQGSPFPWWPQVVAGSPSHFFFKLASLPRSGLLSSRPAVSSSGHAADTTAQAPVLCHQACRHAAALVLWPPSFRHADADGAQAQKPQWAQQQRLGPESRLGGEQRLPMGLSACSSESVGFSSRCELVQG